MLKEHQRYFNMFFQFFDMFIVALAWVLSYPLRFIYLADIIPVRKGYPLYDEYFYITGVIVIIWYAVFNLTGVYKSRRTQSLWPELLALARAQTVAFIIFAALTFLTTAVMFSRGVLLVFFVLVNVFFVVERIALRFFLKNLRRKGFNRRNVLIVGDNEIAKAFLERLHYHPELGLAVMGVIRLDELPESSRTGLQVLGTCADLTKVLTLHKIDQVFLALRNADRDQLDMILSSVMEQNVDVRIIPDLHQFITLGCDVEEFEGMPLISLNQSPIVGWNSVAKRISDILYASLAFLIFSPLMALIALAIKIFSPGPIIHRQQRMGLDGRVFQMLKFRTMRVDAESATGAVWATKNDNRVTWIGKILRRTSLDELPQFINVLKGEMSCVGPRPERPELVQKFKHDIPKYMLRHKVKAGITGWAQVNGLRGDTSLEKRIEYDLYYISNWSLFFDFKIMIMTLFKGFVSKNAY
ncbi:MAG: undecaprenyl-phosphate glucose phosphotransferase [Oligoflexia bacterium]|nr:undecaprenyl-phosphate glucose phosphotransferase [Oligoflexia bacterium]